MEGASCRCGVRLRLTDAQEDPLPPVQVASAAAWARAHQQRLQEGSIKGWASAAVEADSSYDWTFTTPYAGSLLPAGPSAPQWQGVDERIDRTLLLARDPILFFEELTLYESELDDNGSMSLTVKARPAGAAPAATG